MLEDKLEEAARADGQIRECIINELAQDPEITVDAAIKVAYKFYSSDGPWKLVVRLIGEMGYPRNAPAIERFMEDVTYLNSPYRGLAGAVLSRIGAQLVVPYFIRAMLDKSIDRQHQFGKHYRYEAIGGICDILESLEREFAVLCGPTIAHFLSQAVSDPDLGEWRVHLLMPFRKLGAASSGYALPALIDLVDTFGVEDADGKEASEFIASFGKEALEPYKYLLPSIEDTKE